MNLLAQRPGAFVTLLQSWLDYKYQYLPPLLGMNSFPLSSNLAYKPHIEAMAIRTDALYEQLVCGGEGESHDWLLIWGDPAFRTLIPHCLGERGYDDVLGELRETIQQTLDRDGLVIFEWRTPPCIMGRRPPFAFDEKFCLNGNHPDVPPLFGESLYSWYSEGGENLGDYWYG